MESCIRFCQNAWHWELVDAVAAEVHGHGSVEPQKPPYIPDGSYHPTGITSAATACTRTRPAPPPAASIASPLKFGLKATEYSTWSGCGSGSTTTVLSTSARRAAADRSLPTEGHEKEEGGCARRTYKGQGFC
jgi:hypothetical protein